MKVFESLEVIEVDGKQVFTCAECGYIMGAVNENYKDNALKHDLPQSKKQPAYLTTSDLFFMREYYCPGCGVMFEVDVLVKDKPEDVTSIKLSSQRILP